MVVRKLTRDNDIIATSQIKEHYSYAASDFPQLTWDAPGHYRVIIDLLVGSAAASHVLWHDVQFVRASLRIEVDQHCILRRVIGHGAGALVRAGGARAADGEHQGVVTLLGVVVCAQVPVLYVVQRVAMVVIRWAFALQLEHNHATARRERGSNSQSGEGTSGASGRQTNQYAVKPL